MEISGIIVLLITIAISRFIGETAFQKLDSDQKLRLMEGFSRTRAFSMIPLILLIGLYWFLMTNTHLDRQLITIGYFGLLIIYIVLRFALNQTKLLQLEMPDEYRRTFAISQAISFGGIAWLFFTLFYK